MKILRLLIGRHAKRSYDQGYETGRALARRHRDSWWLVGLSVGIDRTINAPEYPAADIAGPHRADGGPSVEELVRLHHEGKADHLADDPETDPLTEE